MGAAARERRFVTLILPPALLAVIVLLAGCPSGPPGESASAPRAAIPTAVTSTLPPPPAAPVLKAGTYDLQEETFAKPWWRAVAGYLSRSGEGVWEGSLRLDRGVRARLQVTGTGSEARAQLTVDTDRDRQLNETPVASRSASAGPPLKDKPTRRFIFPAIDGGNGTSVSLGAETSEANPRAVRVFALLDRCLAATVPTDGKPQVIRFLPASDGAKLWLDVDGSDTPAPWELASADALVGLGSKLYEVQVNGSEPARLTLADYSGEQATIVFDATDGHAKQRGVYAPRVEGRKAVQYVGLVAKASLPAGEVSIQYLLPNNDQGASVARVSKPLRLKAGQEQTLKAGGPVAIGLEANASGDTVDASVSLSTAAGDPITDWVGEQEQQGTIEVIGPDGTVLDTGEAGFG